MKFNLEQVKVFENYEIENWEEGQVTLTTKVVDSSLNYYGNAHGGYLFTLCDQVSGLVAISTGYEAVTLQSNINYLRAGRLDDLLTVIGTCVHNGMVVLQKSLMFTLKIRKTKWLQLLFLQCL